MARVSHFLLLLSSLLWRYSPFLVPTLSFLIEPAIRAFVNADFRCFQPLPPHATHPVLSLPYEGHVSLRLSSEAEFWGHMVPKACAQ